MKNSLHYRKSGTMETIDASIHGHLTIIYLDFQEESK